MKNLETFPKLNERDDPCLHLTRFLSRMQMGTKARPSNAKNFMADWFSNLSRSCPSKADLDRCLIPETPATTKPLVECHTICTIPLTPSNA